jgi:peptidoglycan/xylan/chitin deacetylase (PgdA/CDA1 family)
MAVLALMYHRTPKQAATSDWDVPVSLLRDQVTALTDAGLRFIPFKEAVDSSYFGHETFVTLTFDDGHESNLDAFEFLHGVGVPPTAFIIRDYSRDGQRGYMTTRGIVQARDICEFGGHGATHSDLTALLPEALRGELEESRSYLEDALQRPVTTMSAPGGRINRAVVSCALGSGYQLIGNSVELLNVRPSPALNRICVRLYHSPEQLVRLAMAGRAYWRARRGRGLVGGLLRGSRRLFS